MASTEFARERGWRRLRKHAMMTVYRAASRLVYKKSTHADWMYEKMRRPSTAAALAFNLLGYYRGRPRIPTPVTAMVEPVFGCNLRCRTCWGTLNLQDRRPPRMPLDLFKKVVDEMPRTVESICFSLMGEPLLHEQLHEMIAYASESGFRTILFTNGTLLKDEKLEQLAAAPLNVLNMSIEADPDNADYMRGVNLDELRANLTEFIQKKREPTEVKLSLVAHPRNLAHVPDVHAQWRDLVQHIKVSPRLGLAEEPGPPPLCMEPWRGNLNIYTNGEVSPCCCDWFTELSIGNVTEHPLGEVVRGARYKQLLDGFLRGEVPNVCLYCREFTVEGAPLRLRKRYTKQ